MKHSLHISAPGVLRERDVRLLAAGRALPLLGDEVAVIGLTLWAYAAGWGPVGVAQLLIAAALPLAVGAPVAGRVVDRVDSRTVTVASAAWQAGCALALAGVTAGAGSGVPARVAVVTLVLLLNCGQAVSGPAWQSLVPHAVPQADVGRAVSVTQAAAGTASVVGPALGGLVAATWGVTAALGADAACLALVAGVAVRLRARRDPQPGAGTGSRGELWAGVAFLRADALLGPLVAGLLAVAVFAHLFVVMAVFLVRGTLHAGADGYGAVMAVIAGSAVGGSLLAGRIGGTLGRARAVVGCTAVVSVAIVLAGLAPTLVVFGAVMAGFGVGQGVLGACLQALLLSRAPEAVRGRVVAAVIGGVQTCTVAGMAVGGVLGTAVSPRVVYAVAGSLGLAVSLAVAVRLRTTLRAADIPAPPPLSPSDHVR